MNNGGLAKESRVVSAGEGETGYFGGASGFVGYIIGANPSRV